MVRFNLSLTLKAVFLAAMTWVAITAWDEVFDRTIIRVLNLNKDSIPTWVFIAVVTTVIAVIVLYVFDLNMGDILGEVLGGDQPNPPSVSESAA